jgi:putative endonuclease
MLLQSTKTLADHSSELGRKGEEIARLHLESLGMQVVMANFTAPIGRNRNGAEVRGEIDLIALDDGSLRFVEVKTRAAEGLMPTESAVTAAKRRRITQTARVYLRIFGLRTRLFGFDVVTVILPARDLPSVSYLRDFWRRERGSRIRPHHQPG